MAHSNSHTGTVLSTEPQARKVLEKMNHTRRKALRTENKTGLQQGDKTGTSPEGVQKTKEQGDAERKRLRDKQRDKQRDRGNGAA